MFEKCSHPSNFEIGRDFAHSDLRSPSSCGGKFHLVQGNVELNPDHAVGVRREGQIRNGIKAFVEKE